MTGGGPEVRNRRVKAVASSPISAAKDEVAEMLKRPDSSERRLRQVAHALEYTAYPLLHIRTVYQNLLTYHSYIAPAEAPEGDGADFWEEWRLLDRLRRDLAGGAIAHEITGLALREGKVFFALRLRLSRRGGRRRVDHAFLQQLPSDYCRIVGQNNRSKYTVAFNMMYFAQAAPGFSSALRPRLGPEGRPGLDLGVLRGLSGVDAGCANGSWYYWVVLPVDRVFVFEIDDVSRNVASPFCGLFLDMIQLSQLEAIQLELLQNPLYSILTGEIPYYDTRDTNTADQYKLSNAGRALFESLWYRMLESSNTGGIGLYMAPLNNMTLHSLGEAPNSMEIVKQGYTDTMAKAGLTGIIPVSAESRAGAVNVSLKIESRFARTVYDCFERMMRCVLEDLDTVYEWEFRMFGDAASDAELEESCRSAMTLGILPAAIVYNALHDRSIPEDLAQSRAIASGGLLDLRIPLVSTYTAAHEGALPPATDAPEAAEAAVDAGWR